jgi:hypothetical protein
MPHVRPNERGRSRRAAEQLDELAPSHVEHGGSLPRVSPQRQAATDAAGRSMGQCSEAEPKRSCIIQGRSHIRHRGRRVARLSYLERFTLACGVSHGLAGTSAIGTMPAMGRAAKK